VKPIESIYFTQSFAFHCLAAATKINLLLHSADAGELSENWLSALDHRMIQFLVEVIEGYWYRCDLIGEKKLSVRKGS
jgi:hypothetical protein